MLSFRYSTAKNNYRILSFDGGGIRGILTATILQRLTEAHPQLIKNTDLFVGTSVGSFIALGLASGMTPEEITQLFSFENSKQIFSKRRPYYLFRPKYNHLPLKEILTEIFSASKRLKDLNKHVVVASFNLAPGQTNHWKPVFFNNFPHSTNADETVVNVALASSAAPIYFPSYNNYVDGGIIANNPDTVAISFAVGKLGAYRRLRDVAHLSFGTGWSPMRIERNTAKWGIGQWAYSFLPGTINPKLPLFSILTDGDVEADTLVSSQILNERYFRISPRLPEKINLDDYKKVPTLIELANEVDLTETRKFIETYWYS